MNGEQLNQWEEVWKQHLAEFNAHKGQWSNNKWREPFQLLGAALIYSYNAIVTMPAEILHKSMRTAIGDREKVWKRFYEKKEEPVFCPNTDKSLSELFSTMHLASSSFRLATALFKIHLNQTSVGSLFEFVVRDDWNRTKLTPHLKNTKNMLCCQKKGPSLDEKTALAIILAHRDEFGHGEEGGGGSAWRGNRDKCAETYPLCRVIEAQLTLASLGVRELSKIH